jgi:ribonuclease G
MSKELVISANHHETRVAILEDDQVAEVYHQRENEYSLAGSIHKGRVTRVLPGMQSAFVDIGLERDAFLYVSDFFEDNEEYDKIVTSVEEKVLKLGSPEAPPSVAPVVAAAPAAEQSVPPVERAERAERVVDAAAEPVGPAAPQVLLPASTPSMAGPPAETRRDEFDRDRRGRRGRRRRGRRDNGRGLPESKFYSPGPQAAPRAEPEGESRQGVRADAGVAESPSAPAAESEDLLVLPGENLAKYRGGVPAADHSEDALHSEHALRAEHASPIEETSGSAGFIEEEPFQEAHRAERAGMAGEAAAGMAEKAKEAAVEEPAPSHIEPARKPEPEIAIAFQVADEMQAPIVLEPETHADAEPRGRASESTEPAAVIGEVETQATAKNELEPAAVESEVVAEAGETDQEPEGEFDTAEPAAAEGAEIPALAADEASTPAGAAAAIAEEEGPEPARIPTSLTAALREQGPRFQHRVSRRMRRRGGRPDLRPEGGRGPAGESQRGPQADTRPQDQRTVSAPKVETRPDKPAGPSISDLLKERQEIIVQIAKEPLGQKGARITSHIALPGRFLVYMPTVDHIGVSRKIPSDDERLRLKRILQTHRTGIPGGYIVRTAGDGRTEEELRVDMMFLYNLWLDMRQKAERKPAPLLIHHDLNVVERILRDQLTSAFKSIWVDNEELYENVLSFVQRFQPALVNRVKMYTRSTPIFDEFGVTAELEKALRPKVWLKSGGYIVINQTEALVAIDVNTGKYVGKSNRLEDTIVKTNTDAIREIVRQIRLRDLGGIIVVDFIDMDERKNRQKVMQALEEAMHADRAPYKILQFNDFGLVAITRKRVKQSLERTLCTPCPYCEGAGYVKSPQTVVGEILQEAHKIAGAIEGKDVMLRVSPDVAKVLKSNQNSFLPELEEILGRTVIVKSDPLLHQDKFDLA